MKRAILSICCVLFAVTTQAVTQHWSNWQTFDHSGELDGLAWIASDKLKAFEPSASFAIKVTLSLPSSFSWKDNANGTGMLLLFTVNANNAPNYYAFQVKGSATSHGIHMDDWSESGTGGIGQLDVDTGISLQAGMDYTFMFAYDNGTLSAYLNNTLVANYDFTNSNWSGLTEIDLSTMPGGYNHRLDALVNDYTFKDFQYSFSMLPEPTALALLALGMAGAVLRRKVA